MKKPQDYLKTTEGCKSDAKKDMQKAVKMLEFLLAVKLGIIIAGGIFVQGRIYSEGLNYDFKNDIIGIYRK